MEIRQAEYLGSYPNYQACPGDGIPEFAFIGRSNVGKSSLINMLCRRSALAHTSKKPGNLPGYGYAVVSKSQRRNWEKMIQDYLVLRSELVCAFVLLDANIPPQKLDIEFINRLGTLSVPFALIYTKADRSKPAELENNIRQIQSALLEHWHELPRQFISAANTGMGREEILTYIESLRSEYSL
jgi:GTP-binding protein